MFRRLFAARSSRPLAPSCSRQLEVEALEDRLAPAFISTGPFPDDLMGNLSTSGPNPTPSFAGSTPSFTTAGFQAPLSSTAVGFAPAPLVPGTSVSAGAASQLPQLEQEIGILFQMAAAQNASLASSLVFDEFFLAIDTFVVFLSEEHGIINPSFQGLPARENAINQNPLELTPVGRLLGSTVFEVTADLLASTQRSGVAV
jgi:hypothetical protein